MAINRIYVKAQDGSPLDTQVQLTGKCAIRGANDFKLTKAEDGSIVATTPYSNVWYMYNQAVADLTRIKWLRTINGVGTSTGLFQITGDKCFSWIPGSTSVQTYKRKTGTADFPRYEYITENRAGGMKILDMCEACESCATQAKIRGLIEDVKIRLNWLKDINLYPTALANARRTMLRNLKIRDLPAVCGVPNQSYPAVADASGRLLGQYATCVHMWNYLVAQAEYGTTVELAAQDPAAFLVKSRRAFKTCVEDPQDASATIQCQIEVRRRTASSTAGDISVYIPDPTIDFQPFDNAAVHANQWTITNDNSDASHKIITTTFPAATVAGTYMLAVYIMPFHYATITDSGGQPMSLDNPALVLQKPTAGSTTDPTDGKAYKSYTYTALNGTLTEALIYGRPTADQYNKSKSFPSKSDTVKLLWDIQVTWTTSGLISGNPVSFVENFNIEPVSPRKPMAELFGNNGMFASRTLYDVEPR